MANQVDTTIIEEGHRNAVVRMAGVLDTSNLSLAPAVAVSSFTNNDPNLGALAGFRVDEIQCSIEPGILVVLSWNGNTPQLIAAIADAAELEFCEVGGLQPNQQNSGYDGNINLETKGYVAGSTTGFTVLLRLVKLYRQ